jgi:zinc and cadmium transporter
MLPETVKVLEENIGWPILAGFLLIFWMERFVLVHGCEEHRLSKQKVNQLSGRYDPMRIVVNIHPR